MTSDVHKLVQRLRERGLYDELRSRAKTAHVLPEEVLGRSRMWTVARVRREFMTYLRQECQLSWPEIGWLMGRDHTTVLKVVQP